MNYNNRRFKIISSSSNGEVTAEIIFNYVQNGNILTCNYSDLNIIEGHLIGIVANDGSIQMSYHQVSKYGLIATGVCSSKPELMPNGKIRLYESWQWTSEDQSKGESILEEV